MRFIQNRKGAWERETFKHSPYFTILLFGLVAGLVCIGINLAINRLRASESTQKDIGYQESVFNVTAGSTARQVKR